MAAQQKNKADQFQHLHLSALNLASTLAIFLAVDVISFFKYLVYESRNFDSSRPAICRSDWEVGRPYVTTPQQDNGYDCGVFTILAADFLSLDLPLDYTNEDIRQKQVREKISLVMLERASRLYLGSANKKKKTVVRN